MPEEVVPKASVDAAASAPASDAVTLPDADVRNLFGLWNDALATLDPDQVAARYSAAPCLLPTVSDVPRTDYDSSGPDWCMDDGIYEFKFGATGDIVKARYSFVYTRDGDSWKIAHHHSSQMPEEVVPKASLKEAAAV